MKFSRPRLLRSLMIRSLGVLPATAVAQEPATAPPPCVQLSCTLTVDWGGGKTSSAYGSDRRYGSGDDFEMAVRTGLKGHGVRVVEAGDTPLKITIRPKVDTRAMCDAMAGTGTNYGCVAMSDVAISFVTADPAVPPPATLRLTNRCGGERMYVGMTKFGEYVGEMIWWSINAAATKEKRPALRC